MNAGRLADVHRASTVKRLALESHDRLVPQLFCTEWIAPSVAVQNQAIRAARHGQTGGGDPICSTTTPRCCGGWRSARRSAPRPWDQGVAFLHARYHDPNICGDSFAVLGRTAGPIFAGAADGGTTDLFFLLCCQDDALHLHVLARLCAMSHSTPLLTGTAAGRDQRGHAGGAGPERGIRAEHILAARCNSLGTRRRRRAAQHVGDLANRWSRFSTGCQPLVGSASCTCVVPTSCWRASIRRLEGHAPSRAGPECGRVQDVRAPDGFASSPSSRFAPGHRDMLLYAHHPRQRETICAGVPSDETN